MTLTQLATPMIDVILVVPLIIKLAQNIAGFTNDAKLRMKSKPGIINDMSENVWAKSYDPCLKIMMFSSFFLASVACLPEADEKIKLAVLYRAKIYRKKIVALMKVRDEFPVDFYRNVT